MINSHFPLKKSDRLMLILSLMIFFELTLFRYVIWYFAGATFFSQHTNAMYILTVEIITLLTCVLIVIGMVLINVTMFLKKLFNKNSTNTTKFSFMNILSIFIMLIGFIFSCPIKKVYAKGLKISIQNEEIDLHKITNWLDLINIEKRTMINTTEEINDSFNIPNDIINLKPDFIILDKTFICLTYGGPLMHYGIVIRLNTDEVQSCDGDYYLDFASNAYIWVK